MLSHPQGLVNEPVCGGGQRHARVRHDEGGESVCHRWIEPDWCRGTLTHDYIVVDMSHANRGRFASVLLQIRSHRSPMTRHGRAPLIFTPTRRPDPGQWRLHPSKPGRRSRTGHDGGPTSPHRSAQAVRLLRQLRPRRSESSKWLVMAATRDPLGVAVRLAPQGSRVNASTCFGRTTVKRSKVQGASSSVTYRCRW